MQIDDMLVGHIDAHDTPLKKLFGSSFRAYSSGCVRVEKVMDLVGWLLSDEEEDWSPDRVPAHL